MKGSGYQYLKTTSQILPRENIIRNGINVLSDKELLSVLLGSGIKGSSVFKIAEKVLSVIDKCSGNVTLSDLTKIQGLGKSKASIVLAALEMSRRVGNENRWKITCPENIFPLLSHYADRPREHFIIFCLNGAHHVIEKQVVSVGVINKTLVHPREVFAVALRKCSAAIIVAHNHPSGDVTPSYEDIQVTKKLLKASDIMEIPLLDHIIFSVCKQYSFAEQGLLSLETLK